MYCAYPRLLEDAEFGVSLAAVCMKRYREAAAVRVKYARSDAYYDYTQGHQTGPHGCVSVDLLVERAMNQSLSLSVKPTPGEKQNHFFMTTGYTDTAAAAAAAAAWQR